MNSEANSSYFHDNQQQGFHIYQAMDEMLYSSSSTACATSSAMVDNNKNNSHTILYNLTVIKNKVHQLESLISVAISTNQAAQHDRDNPHNSLATKISSIGNIVQEIIVSASSLMCGLQQISATSVAQSNHHDNEFQPSSMKFTSFDHHQHQNSSHDQEMDLFSTEINFNHSNQQVTCDKDYKTNLTIRSLPGKKSKEIQDMYANIDSDIIELEAADLLAKYTHYCQVCGKGFRRDANLRMHMRAHGDEYKTTAALTNPKKGNSSFSDQNEDSALSRKYSCPHEGCRWNKNHPKFQPLKSMICVKNHYKRSHCPKMYVCKRCNIKQFSVLSDLRTHEKHCGDLRWRCSCGTNFSRKDKLMGHVTLFVGHTPLLSNFDK